MGNYHCWYPQGTILFFCLDSAALPMLNEQHFNFFDQIKTSQKEVSHTLILRPYCECSLANLTFNISQ